MSNIVHILLMIKDNVYPCAGYEMDTEGKIWKKKWVLN